jgi:hypothetical protein
MSAFRGKADMVEVGACPLMTQGGHEQFRIAVVQTDPEPHVAGHKSLL